MFHKCNVRDCASSAKSFVIVFDDYESYITVPSIPKENGVPVKINVILLRFPQANLFLSKIIVFDFTGACFDAIVRPDRVISERAETSVTESPENKGIRVERYSHKHRRKGRWVGGGGGGGLQPPQILSNSDFLGSKRNLGKASF